MEKKTRNILIIVICIVVLLPLLLIILGLGGFILTDLFRSLSYDGAESFGNMLKYLGVAIIVIGVPLTLYLTRKK